MTATHASLTEPDVWDRLPSMTHCHYDEVHRITGDEFYKLLEINLDSWKTAFLTGTSATPKTCAMSQHTKIAKIFGNPLISVGDVIVVKYPSNDLDGTQKFIVTNVTNSYNEGLETSITCRSIYS